MKHTFIYKKKFSYSYFIPAVLFIGLAIFCQVEQYGIAFKNLDLLLFPNSVYILAGLSVVFIAFAIYKMMKSKNSASNPNPIVMNDLVFSFPSGSANKIDVNYMDVNEFWNKEDSESEDDGEQVIIYTEESKNRYEFSADHFVNKGEFELFKNTLKSVCTNVKK